MKAISDVKLNYVIQKIKAMFSPKEHTHDVSTLTDDRNMLATKEHTHDLSTDVKGILQPEHGGTGVDNIEDMFADGAYVRASTYTYIGDGKTSRRFVFKDDFYPMMMIIIREYINNDKVLTLCPMMQDTHFWQGDLDSEGNGTKTVCININKGAYTSEDGSISGYSLNLTVPTGSLEENAIEESVKLFNEDGCRYYYFVIGSTSSSTIKLVTNTITADS